MSKSVSLPVVIVNPLTKSGSTTGIQYLDYKFSLHCDKKSQKLIELFDLIERNVTDHSSILLYKEDVRRLADQLSNKSCTSKEVFQTIKQHLRSKYHVLKLSFDPRTLQFNGIKTCFIIHKI